VKSGQGEVDEELIDILRKYVSLGLVYIALI
jgi:hypothetical protein